MRSVCFFLVIISLLSCNTKGKGDTDEQLCLINLSEAISKPTHQLLLSDVADDIKIVPLESNEATIFNRVKHLLSNNDGIFIVAQRRIMRFNKDGKYLCDIGQFGQGPGEFLFTCSIGYNDGKKEIYVPSLMDAVLKVYDVNGNYIHSINLFNKNESIGTNSNAREDRAYRFIDNHHFLRRMLPIPGIKESPWQLLIKDSDLNKTLELVNPNIIKYQTQYMYEDSLDISKAGSNWEANAPVISYYKGKRSILFDSNDTIYSLDTKNNYITAKYLLLTNSNTISAKELHVADKSDNYLNNYIHPIDFIETNDYIFVVVENKTFSYLCQFDKTTRNIKSIRNQGEIRHSDFMNVNYRKVSIPEFTDDLTGGCPFFPDHTNDNEWIGVIPAERLLSEIDINELEKKEVKLPHRKQQLINVLKNLKEDDNPVLMIVKLK